MTLTKQVVTTFLLTNARGDSLSLETYEVEDLRRDLGASSPVFNGAGIPMGCKSSAEWMLLALQGKPIDAIKALRAKQTLGLKEAKDTVELFLARLSNIEADLVDDARIPF